MGNVRFWEEKKLNELTRDEWEALCCNCAKCCTQKGKDGKPVEMNGPGSLCYLLDQGTCRCSSYSNRHELMPQCIELTADRPEVIEQMPATCSYRLLLEGKPLPDWHPLITGDPSSSLKHKILVHGKINPDLPPAPAPTDQPPEKSSLPDEERNNQLTETATEIISRTLNAVESTNLMGGFHTTTTHEIRNALNGIVGMAQLLSDTQLTLEQQNYIDTIQQSTTRLLKTINYILDISKMESGQMDLCETTTDLRSMCDRLHHAFASLAEQKNIDFHCECLSGVPLSVMCDEPLLERMLGNFLKHALDHAPDGSIALQIDCLNKSRQGAELTFRFMGSGLASGIHVAQLKEAAPADAVSFREASSSSDMDLTVGRRIIELMNGELALENAEYRVNLTLRQANHPASLKLAGIDRVKTVRENTRVLLAEDNKLNQKAVASILRKAGCRIDVVDNGKEALRKIEEHPYDLILMDCLMPVMDGFEATSRIRAKEDSSEKIPILALTAHAMKGDKQKCLDAGMDAYLTKPVERQDLIDAINRFTNPK